MYIPEHFSIKDTSDAYKIIEAHPLGALVISTNEGLEANHLPFELNATQGVLTAHVARSNPILHKRIEGLDVLVIFRGAESYISPNWYPSKHESHRQVPTWNYQAVHVHGRLVIQDREKFVRGAVARLTRRHEANEPRPWRMTDSPPEYIDEMLKSIVGIEIHISRLEGKAKLSQNRERRDRLGAAERLTSSGSPELGEAMKKGMPPK